MRGWASVWHRVGFDPAPRAWIRHRVQPPMGWLYEIGNTRRATPCVAALRPGTARALTRHRALRSGTASSHPWRGSTRSATRRATPCVAALRPGTARALIRHRALRSGTASSHPWGGSTRSATRRATPCVAALRSGTARALIWHRALRSGTASSHPWGGSTRWWASLAATHGWLYGATDSRMNRLIASAFGGFGAGVVNKVTVKWDAAHKYDVS